MTKESLEVFMELLNQVTVKPTTPDFVEVAAKLARVVAEVTADYAQYSTPPVAPVADETPAEPEPTP